MKKSFFILLAGILFQACTSPVDPAPADLLSEKKMTGILVDIHILESRIETLGLPHDTASNYFRTQQQEIFRKHQVKADKFFKSYDYYVTNVSELDKIYEKVVDSLSVKEVEAQTPATPQPAASQAKAE
ncbi:MAG: DUF4296 domain-containing protein [Adhaeribacter sp.]